MDDNSLRRGAYGRCSGTIRQAACRFGRPCPWQAGKIRPAQSRPRDAQELARQLINSKCLTKFQVQEIYLGRSKSLILGNYTILDKIGEGGMGQVLKAQHRRMDRVVAIKMLPKNVMRDPAHARSL